MGSMTLRQVRRFAAIGILFSTAGCYFVTPIASDITPETVALELKNSDLRADFTMLEAVAYGRKLRKAYEESIDNQLLLRNITDLTLIPVLGSAAFLGISGGSSDVILGLVTGGTAIHLTGERFSNSQDQLIYAGGVLAINCVLGTFESQRIAYGYRSSLVKLVGGPTYQNGKPILISSEIRETIKLLEDLLGQPGLKGNSPLEQSAKATIATAINVRETTGRKTLNLLDTSGDLLISALNSVKGHVTKSLINNQIDGGRFRDSVASAFRSSLVRIPKTQDQIPDKADRQDSEDSAKTDEIKRLKALLETQIQAVKDIASVVERPPSAEGLRKCAFDVDEAGLTLAVSKPGPISVPLTENSNMLTEDKKISFTILGGRPPYKASWAGVLSDKLLEPTITTGGVLTAVLKEELKKGLYELEILDTSRRTIPILVQVKVGSLTADSGPGGGGSEGAVEGYTKEQIKDVQEFLHKEGNSTVEVNGNSIPVPTNGEFDEATKQAVISFLTKHVPESADTYNKLPNRALLDLVISEIAKVLVDDNGNQLEGPTPNSVKFIQNFLRDNGYTKINENGVPDPNGKELLADSDFGNMTKNAVSHFLSNIIGYPAEDLNNLDEEGMIKAILDYTQTGEDAANNEIFIKNLAPDPEVIEMLTSRMVKEAQNILHSLDITTVDEDSDSETADVSVPKEGALIDGETLDRATRTAIIKALITKGIANETKAGSMTDLEMVKALLIKEI